MQTVNLDNVCVALKNSSSKWPIKKFVINLNYNKTIFMAITINTD